MSDIEIRIKDAGRFDSEAGPQCSAEAKFIEAKGGLPKFIVTVQTSVACPDETQIQDFERAFLSRAAEILSSLASISSDQMIDRLKKQRLADHQWVHPDA